MDKNILILVDGSVDDSKRFVETVKNLGYRTKKINPKRLPKEIGKLYFPNEHPNTEFAYKDIQTFLNGQNAYYWYIVKEVMQLRDIPSVSILVNSKEFVKELQDDYGAFYIGVGDVDGGYDKVVSSDRDFVKNVDKLLQFLTKDIGDVKYKEIE